MNEPAELRDRSAESEAPKPRRPDLRPMLILVGLIVLVTLGWVMLTPLILPPAR